MNNYNQISDIAIVSEATHDDDDDSSMDLNFPPFSTQTGKTSCDNHTTENNSDYSEHTVETNASDSDVEDPNIPPFFCNKMDDDDEAWVLNNIRGGNDLNHNDICTGDERAIHAGKIRKLDHFTQVAQDDRGEQEKEDNKNLHNLEKKVSVIGKPRHSDAILSCPYCFNIVCMDCQKHERFSNQYRAMFVMNIAVCWDNPQSYDSHSQQLRPRNLLPSNLSYSPVNASVSDRKSSHVQFATIPEEEKMYYFVQCDNCSTGVAVLDNDEELYHFIDCVASS